MPLEHLNFSHWHDIEYTQFGLQGTPQCLKTLDEIILDTRSKQSCAKADKNILEDRMVGRGL